MNVPTAECEGAHGSGRVGGGDGENREEVQNGGGPGGSHTPDSAGDCGDGALQELILDPRNVPASLVMPAHCPKPWSAVLPMALELLRPFVPDSWIEAIVRVRVTDIDARRARRKESEARAVSWGDKMELEDELRETVRAQEIAERGRKLFVGHLVFYSHNAEQHSRDLLGLCDALRELHSSPEAGISKRGEQWNAALEQFEDADAHAWLVALRAVAAACLFVENSSIRALKVSSNGGYGFVCCSTGVQRFALHGLLGPYGKRVPTLERWRREFLGDTESSSAAGRFLTLIAPVQKMYTRRPHNDKRSKDRKKRSKRLKPADSKKAKYCEPNV